MKPDNNDPVPFAMTAAGSYQNWTRLPIRYSDQDPVGHVNNTAISTYFEQARCEVLLPLIEAHGTPDLDIVLARIEIDYLKEIRYPGSVDIGTRIARLGTKSLVIACTVFADGTARAAALATIVFFDKGGRRSTEPPPALRQALVALMF